MPTQFDLKTAKATEFGVGVDHDGNRRFVLVAVDVEVQTALQEMIVTTREAMRQASPSAKSYDPSEINNGLQHLIISLEDGLVAGLRALHQANNLPTESTALSSAANVFCYFARVTDGKGGRMTAVRRATTFKGVLKSRLLQLTSDALKIVQERIFKLDHDFDILIEEGDIEILRRSGFELLGELEAAILGAVSKNITTIKADLTFVDFALIESYAVRHPRAARCLASIRMQQETKSIDKNYLKKACKDTGVSISELNGKLTVDEGSIMGFLRVLDRRQYRVELVKGSPESYQAQSRSKIVNGTQLESA